MEAKDSIIRDSNEAIAIKEISFVVQGAVVAETKLFLEEIRRNYPESEIVLSTWEGSPVENLQSVCDQIVLSKDPGAAIHVFYADSSFNNNINRQIVSTVAGIQAASRKLVAKCRTDFTLQNTGLLEFWSRYPKRFAEHVLFQHRVIVPSLYSRIYSDQPNALPTPFHPSDIFAFGLKDDLLLMFGSCPLQSPKEMEDWIARYPNRLPYSGAQWRWAPEQAFFYYAVKTKYKNLNWDDNTVFTKDIINQSRNLLMNNFIFVNPNQIGLYSRKHIFSLRKANLHYWPGIVSNTIFENWYKDYLDHNLIMRTDNRGSALDRYEYHRDRLRANLKTLGAFFQCLLEPFVCIRYAFLAKIRGERRL